jgi:hypothetical protein
MRRDRAVVDFESFWGEHPRRERTRGERSRHEPPHRRGFGTLTIGLLVLAIVAASVAIAGTQLPDGIPYLTEEAGSRGARRPVRLPTQRLDGRGNNLRHPEWGQAGRPYARVVPAAYADGIGEQVTGPDVRYVSNRVFNDTHRNIFSERDVTQWVFTWGQFIDHTIGLRDEAGEQADMPFAGDDPLEEFSNTLGAMPFTRSAAAPGTGVDSPREQTNTVSSYINAWAVYGGTEERLEWLRDGPVDGDLSNNSAHLLLPGAYLPRRDSRGDPASAPAMAVDGALRGAPDRAAVAGDVRANENIALQATQTLFAREHNRIVDLLPDDLSEEQRFQIARRVIIAEQQYITYNEFLPAVGVRLPRYRGYRPDVNTTLTNEFATVGYRAHSMIHGEIELEADVARYDGDRLAALQGQGIEVETSEDGAEVTIAVPLNVAYFNPDLVESLELGPLLRGIGLEAQYNNDEMIDNQLRSVLFQIPVSGNPACLDGEELPACFQGVVDLGALDIQRGRDHGIPSYNELRAAYGLRPKRTFEAVTGEPSSAFPADPLLTAGEEIDDPESLDIVARRDIDGNELPLEGGGDGASAVDVDRRTPLAARMRAIYGSVDRLDAFVGMVAEPHVRGSEFGELQLAIWAREFRALRDGDRFFYGNDPGLRAIARAHGIDFRRTLAEVIADNTDVPVEQLAENVFFVEEEAEVAAGAPPPPTKPPPTTPPPTPPPPTAPRPPRIRPRPTPRPRSRRPRRRRPRPGGPTGRRRRGRGPPGRGATPGSRRPDRSPGAGRARAASQPPGSTRSSRRRPRRSADRDRSPRAGATGSSGRVATPGRCARRPGRPAALRRARAARPVGCRRRGRPPPTRRRARRARVVARSRPGPARPGGRPRSPVARRRPSHTPPPLRGVQDVRAGVGAQHRRLRCDRLGPHRFERIGVVVGHARDRRRVHVHAGRGRLGPVDHVVDHPHRQVAEPAGRERPLDGAAGRRQHLGQLTGGHDERTRGVAVVVDPHVLPGGPADDPHLVALGGDEPDGPAALGVVAGDGRPQRRRGGEPLGDVGEHVHRQRCGVSRGGGDGEHGTGGGRGRGGRRAREGTAPADLPRRPCDHGGDAGHGELHTGRSPRSVTRCISRGASP